MMEKEYREDKIKEMDIEIELMRREVDNLKREMLREQREREEIKRRTSALEKEEIKKIKEREEEMEGEKGLLEENEKLKKKVADLEEEIRGLKEKLRKQEKKEVSSGEKERKVAENIEKISERFIDKEKTLLIRKGKMNRNEKIEAWMKRHAGEVEFKVAKLWTTEAARWLIFKDRVDRGSLLVKEKKINAEEIYNIEEVKEGRERWCSKKGGVQMERLERIRNGRDELRKKEEFGNEQAREDGADESVANKAKDKEEEMSEGKNEKDKEEKVVEKEIEKERSEKGQDSKEDNSPEKELGEI